MRARSVPCPGAEPPSPSARPTPLRVRRCVGTIAEWPAKEGTLTPVWNSARQLEPFAAPAKPPAGSSVDAARDAARGVAAEAPLSLRLELWREGGKEGRDALVGLAYVALAKLENATRHAPLTVPLHKPSAHARQPLPSGRGGPRLEPSRAGTAPSAHRSSLLLARVKPSGQTSKQVFFVRHGESRWNEAQAKGQVIQMLSTVDHPLNATGYAQATALGQAIRTAVDDPQGELNSSASESNAIRSLVSATAVWSSPLTRAMQTAMIGLEPLLQRPSWVAQPDTSTRDRDGGGGSGDGDDGGGNDGVMRKGRLSLHPAAREVRPERAFRFRQGSSWKLQGSGRPSLGLTLELKPNAREKKNTMGRDTIGTCTGKECRARAIGQLLHHHLASEEVARSLSTIAVGSYEVEQQWWVTAAESREQLGRRLDELMHQLQHSPHEVCARAPPVRAHARPLARGVAPQPALLPPRRR